MIVTLLDPVEYVKFVLAGIDTDVTAFPDVASVKDTFTEYPSFAYTGGNLVIASPTPVLPAKKASPP